MQAVKENAPAAIISSHRVKSREVTEKDLPRIIADSKKMMPFLHEGIGVWRSGIAIAHSQITKEDPMRFFVLRDGRIIVNPEIIRHTKNAQLKDDACLTFHGIKNPISGMWEVTHPVVKVPRWTKIDCRFGIVRDAESEKPYIDYLEESLTGKNAQVFQHEIDHMNAVYIYDHTPNPLSRD